MRILVVDDEHLVRWFLERALTQWGHKVNAAPNAKDALKKLRNNDYDVVFTDLRMPEGDGSHLIRKVSEMPEKNMKMVVCSAFITTEMTTDYKQQGILTLKKPFKLAELEKIMKRCSS